MSRFLSRAGEQVAELAELAAEAGRLSRGRALFRKGSVSDLSIMEGSVTASVRGSKGDDYETTISTAPAPPGVRRQVAHDSEDRRSVDDLIDDGIDVCPREIDLVFACDCADWDEPCKHVVAVFLAFADRVDLDEAELLRWRGIDSSGASGGGSRNEEPEVPSRSAAKPRVSTQPTSTERREAAAAGDRTARLSKLESLLGDTVMRIPTVDASEAGPSPSTLEPALAEFLGVDTELDPVDVSGIAAVAPLFASIELGPLADLGPELAKAVATITACLEDTSP
ncbi:MAG: hypothetical protein WBM50_18455 [Acidimicrobiales bacterium]